MKFVNKGAPPSKYRAWLRTVAGTETDYRSMPGDIKSAIISALIKEQGEICGYTMKRIDENSSHVEHVKPETVCRAENVGSDLHFDNMLACFPRTGMIASDRYGAQKKGSWWKPELFVSPFAASCERRFRFSHDGSIEPVNDDAAAKETIGILGLDHKTLTEDRRRAIKTYIFGGDGCTPLSKGEAEFLLRNVCNKSAGKFDEFCVALRDALEDHIKYLKKLSRQKVYAQKSRARAKKGKR